jgi:glutathione peroxidase
MSALDFKMKGQDGKDVDLGGFKGKVVLFVNVASRCGYTKQYTGLQALHERYREKGLAIIGVPVNDFGAQEPGTDAEIAQFCSTNYGVSFPVLAKVPTIVGAAKVPLYKHLTEHARSAGEVKWNFTKFLVGRDGQVAGRFEPGVDPEAQELTTAIDRELARQ